MKIARERPDMILIAAPDGATPFVREVNPEFSQEEFLRVSQYRDEIMRIVQEAVRDYVMTHHPEDSRLTGRYYLSREEYLVSDAPWFERVGRKRQHCFSVMAHCLGMFEVPEGRKEDDYLGLEVHFIWDVETGKVIFHGDVDSSSI